MQLLNPGVNEGLIADRARLHVNHTAAGHSGRRSDRQVLYFEHHCHVVGERDDLSGVKAELLIVVEHSVHGLNPEGIDGAIEHDPMLFVRLVL